MRRRRVILVAAVASVLVAISGACGGGGDDVPFDGETVPSGDVDGRTVPSSDGETVPSGGFADGTVRSGDGVLTVEVPAGAAANGVEIAVTRIAGGELPPELQGADAVAVVLGYELGPDGAQFSAPVTLTFRLDPAAHGLDLPVGAVPLALLLTENGDGDLEGIEGAEVSYEDGEIVVRGTVRHFTPAILVLANNVAFLLVPSEIELAVGDSRMVEVISRDLSTGETLALPVSFSRTKDVTGPQWTTAPPFTVGRGRLSAPISCTAPTDEWVEDAYRVLITATYTDLGKVWSPTLGETVLLRVFFGASTAAQGIRLAGDGKCNASTSTDTGTSVPAGPRSSANTSYPVMVSGTSGSVAVNANDCFGERAPVDQCPDEVDIAGMSWGPVEGSPNLLRVTLSFVGPFAGPTETLVTISLFSDGPSLGTTVSLVDGNMTCTFPGSDGPLAGESCALNAVGKIDLVRDVSGMNRIRISIRSRQGSGDSQVGDAVQISGIQRP